MEVKNSPATKNVQSITIIMDKTISKLNHDSNPNIVKRDPQNIIELLFSHTCGFVDYYQL